MTIGIGKRSSAHKIESISKHVVEHCDEHMSNDEIPITAEDSCIEVPDDKEADVCAMLKEYEQAWSGQIGEINVTET